MSTKKNLKRSLSDEKMQYYGRGLLGFKFENWSRTFRCQPELFFLPRNVEELREIILTAKVNRKHVRIVGCGHSPSDIACTDDYMVSLRYFNRILSIDEEKYTVKAECGITLTELNEHLQRHNLAMTILGSVSDVTLGGVINTASHGSGIKYNVISMYVIELELITSSGDKIKCSRNERSDVFLSALCGLGALGVIINATIQCEPIFLLHRTTYPSTLTEVLKDLDDHVSSSDHFRFLWFPHTENVSVWHTNRIYNGKKMNYTRIEKLFNWIIDYGVGFYLLEFSYWLSTHLPKLVPYINRLFFWILYNRNQEIIDDCTNVFTYECLFKQFVNEWSIPKESVTTALLSLKKFIESNNSEINVHFPVEVRFVKCDDIYLSPAYGRDSCYINVIMYRPYGKHVEHRKYWENYERIMKSLGGRPHWAKAHSETGIDFVKMYPYFRLWAQVRKRLDPLNMFINLYLERIFDTLPIEVSKDD